MRWERGDGTAMGSVLLGMAVGVGVSALAGASGAMADPAAAVVCEPAPVTTTAVVARTAKASSPVRASTITVISVGPGATQPCEAPARRAQAAPARPDHPARAPVAPTPPEPPEAPVPTAAPRAPTAPRPPEAPDAAVREAERVRAEVQRIRARLERLQLRVPVEAELEARAHAHRTGPGSGAPR